MQSDRPLSSGGYVESPENKSFGFALLKGAMPWEFGIISKAQKWINRNRNRKIMV